MPATMTWPLAEVDSRFSWGVISVIDRVGAANRFISFGGHLAVSRDREVHAALFRSDAPILSLGGHSELPDPLSGQIAGFMARLRGASGYDSPVRHMAESLSPVALYAAFVSRVVGLYRRPDAAGSVSPHLVSLLRAEQHRVGVEFPADFDAGRKLAELL